MVQPPLVELKADTVAKLSLKLQETRIAQSLSIHKVAKDLLFSKRQVMGLESGVSQSFYSPRIYALAAKKYCDYLGLEFDTADLLIHLRPSAAGSRGSASFARPGERLVLAKIASSAEQGRMRSSLRWVGLAALLAGVGLYSQQERFGKISVIVQKAAGSLAVAEAAPEAVAQADEPSEPSQRESEGASSLAKARAKPADDAEKRTQQRLPEADGNATGNSAEAAIEASGEKPFGPSADKVDRISQ